MPVPPPPAPPPPPTLSVTSRVLLQEDNVTELTTAANIGVHKPAYSYANTEKPSLNRSEQAGRNALLSDITKGKKLKKAVTNDRSAPILDKPKGSGGGGSSGSGFSSGSGSSGGSNSYSGGGGSGPPGLGGLFQAGMPKLRSTNRENDSPGSRGPVFPPGGRAMSAKPFSPSGSPGRFPGPSAGQRIPAPEPQRSRMPPPRPDAGSRPDTGAPPVPNTPRPVPSSLHNRGAPPMPGASRQASLGLTAPSFPGSRNLGFGGSIRQSTTSSSASTSPFSNRPPLPPAPGRSTEDKPPPPPPPMGNRPPLNREPSLPPPPPQNNKPPIPSTPRPSFGSSVPPPPPPSRPGPPPVPPTSGGNDDMPRLPQRNISLASPSPPSLPGCGRAGPLPPPPSERPPPPVRDPPSRSGSLPPPPPPISRNGSTSRALPATPQLPSRGGFDKHRGGPVPPPPPPDRPGSGAPPPPPPPPSSAMRNGFQDSACDDEWESRFSFHPLSDLPPPEPYVPMNKSYPSKLARNDNRSGSSRRERGAPPLPPIPR